VTEVAEQSLNGSRGQHGAARFPVVAGIGNIGGAVPRAHWIAQSLKAPAASMSIGQMAVHDYGDIQIVSFARRRTEASRGQPAVAVVDVWLQSGRKFRPQDTLCKHTG